MMKKMCVVLMAAVAILAVELLAATPFSGWLYRSKITFSGYDGTGGLTNFPALVVASGDTIAGFVIGDCEADGSDIRFTDSAGNEIPYEIDSWDYNSAAYIWVRVPLLQSNEDYIWLYWGKPGAEKPAYTSDGSVWSESFKGVWHLGESSARDSTSYGNNGSASSNVDAAGMVGKGQYFDNTSRILCGDDESLKLDDSLTITVWIKPASVVGNRVILAKHGTQYFGLNGTMIRYTTLGKLDHDSASTSITVGSWHHVGLTFTPDSVNGCKYYLNGELFGQRNSSVARGGVNNFYIGARESGPYFDGVIDELSVSDVVRSADWIAAEYATVAANQSFMSYGEAEPRSIMVMGADGAIIANGAEADAVMGSDFGIVVTNLTVVQRVFTITNRSDGLTFTLTSEPLVGISGAKGGFSVVSQPDRAVFNPGESSSFTVEFAPQELGVDSGWISFTTVGGNMPEYSFEVRGFGEAGGVLEVSGNSGYGVVSGEHPKVENGSDFGVWPGAVTEVRNFVITNSGVGQLIVDGMSLQGSSAFSLNGPAMPLVLAAGESEELEVTLTAEAPGSYVATIELSNNSLADLFVMEVMGVIAEGVVYVSTDGDDEADGRSWATAKRTIQAGIDTAEVGEMVLVDKGRYLLSEQLVISKDIRLEGAYGRDETVIDGGYPIYENRCMLITNCCSVVSGFTVSNGFAYGADSYGGGGGMQLLNFSGTIENSYVRNNRALKTDVGGDGGGIYIDGGAPVVRNCTIDNNDTMSDKNSAKRGTGVFIENSAPFIYNCIITNNIQLSSGGTGAGIWMNNSGSGIISNCVINGNYASQSGGGVYVYGGVFTHCLISNNSARVNAGGVNLYGHATASILRHSTVVANRANGGAGGGVDINRGTIENCVITYNYAKGSGGGVYSNEGYLRNCLIAANEATATGGGVHRINKSHANRNLTIVRNKAGTDGGGLYNISATADNFLNCIIADNSAATSNDYYSTASSIGYSCAPELADGVNGNITAVPGFVDAGSGYGLEAVLGDYRLASGSPCIDSGYNASDIIGLNDLDGNPRVRPHDGMIDMGCYEGSGGGDLSCFFTLSPAAGLPPLWVSFNGFANGSDVAGATYRWIFDDGVVSDWSDSPAISHSYLVRVAPYSPTLEVTNAVGHSAIFTHTNGVSVYPEVIYVALDGGHIAPYDSWARAATNIQTAIDTAGSGFTREIIVSNGVYVVTNEIAFNKAILLRSEPLDREKTIVVGSHPTVSSRIFNITASGAILDSFTVTNGYLNSGSNGAGILMTAGTTVRNSKIAGNFAKGYGGGLHITNGKLLDSLVVNNGSQNIAGGGFQMTGNSAVVSNCLIAGNSQLNGSGGALRIDGGLLVDCVISNNTASTGGGIHKQGNSLIDRCVVVHNQATKSGGGLHANNASGASGTIRNTLFVGNKAGEDGGGVWLGHDALLINCTVTGNEAVKECGGVFLGQYDNGTKQHYVTNSIIYYNTAGANPATADIGGPVTNVGYSCVAVLTDGVNGNVTAPPRFVKAKGGYGLAWQGGDYRLWRDSPAVGSGLYVGWMDDASDLSGEARLQGTQPNMGAYEARLNRPGTVLLVR